MCLRDWNKALRRAIQKNDLELLQICIENGADINEPDRNGYTPLMKAAILFRYRATKILLESGADIGAKNKKGETAYDFVKNNSNSMLRALLKQPADKFRQATRNKISNKKLRNFRKFVNSRK